MRSAACLAVLALVLAMSACGGESRTYSVEEVEAAFSEQGFDLEVPSELADHEWADPDGAALAQPATTASSSS